VSAETIDNIIAWGMAIGFGSYAICAPLLFVAYADLIDLLDKTKGK
jgi:hypothetical protein